eukprot:11876268-Alexandrium_andersonii.AAC.1
MSASLVGSEMCIRDRDSAAKSCGLLRRAAESGGRKAPTSAGKRRRAHETCLLYTSDAADDM